MKNGSSVRRVIKGAWAPQPGPQTEAIRASWCDEIFFGGARGGGKTDYLLGDFLKDVPKYERHWQGTLFRKSYKELEEIIRRSHELYTITGAEFKKQQGWWVWPNGARLKLRHLENELDSYIYQGDQNTWLGWDELGKWKSLKPYDILKATLRWAEADVPTKRIRSSGNPGGPNHQNLKRYFIEHAPLGFKPYFDPKSKMSRMYIPSKVTDNKILLARDPNYIDRLKSVGSAELVRAWLEGDWSAIVGSYFTISLGTHVIHPFQMPKHWPRFMVMDWGAAGGGDPFSIGWFGLVCEQTPVETLNGNILYAPKETLICYRRWNGAGLPKVTFLDVAQGIKEREKEEILFRVAGGDILEQKGHGESIFGLFAKEGIHFRMADRRRINGWEQMNYRLKGRDGVPMLYWFDECAEDVETIGSLQHDLLNPNDVAQGNDHDGERCFIGSTLVETNEGPIAIKDLVGREGQVWSSDGKLHNFRNCRRTQTQAEVWKLTLMDGREIIATPNHRFLSNGEWKELKDLRFRSRIDSVTLSIKELDGNHYNIREMSGISGRSLLSLRILFHKANRWAKEQAQSFASSCLGIPQWGYSQGIPYSPQGPQPGQQFHREFRINRSRGAFANAYDYSRSKTKKQQMAEGQQSSSTRGYYEMEKESGGEEVLQRKSFPKSLGQGLQSGIKLSFLWQKIRDRIFKAGIFKILSSQLQNEGNEAKVKSIAPCGTADVYCLEVPDTENFAIEGGLIVHNCRYACMTRPLAQDAPITKELDYRGFNERATVSAIIDKISQPEKKSYVTRR